MSRLHLLLYALPGLPLAFAALPVYVHVPQLYALTTSLQLAVLGGVLLTTRVLDAVIDPWLGWLADRMPRRRMLLLAMWPLALGFVALLNPGSGAPLLWLVGALLLTYLGYSAATVAYQAWGAAIGANSVERTRLTAARETATLLGIILASLLPLGLASTTVEGVSHLAWILPPLLFVCVFVTLSQLKHEGAVHRPHDFAPEPALRSALHDLRFRRLLSVFLLNGLAAAIPATLFMFYVSDVLLAPDAAGRLLLLYFVSGAVSMPLWVRLAGKLGKVRAWGWGMALALVAFAGAGSLGPHDTAAFALICVASGCALGADLALPAALAADVGEAHGQPGACFGLWNMVAKLNLALAAGVALPLVSHLGYQPGQSATSTALLLAYAGLPLLFKLCALVLLWRWRTQLEDPT